MESSNQDHSIEVDVNTFELLSKDKPKNVSWSQYLKSLVAHEVMMFYLRKHNIKYNDLVNKTLIFDSNTKMVRER